MACAVGKQQQCDKETEAMHETGEMPNAGDGIPSRGNR